MPFIDENGTKKYWHEVALLLDDEVVYCDDVGYDGVCRFLTQTEVDDQIERLRAYLRTKAAEAEAEAEAAAPSEAAVPSEAEAEAEAEAERESDSTTDSDAASNTASESDSTTDSDSDW
jgi:hypothetical protein